MKTNFQAYPDEFIIKTNALGDTIWCKTYHGTNSDGSENGSSIVELPGVGYAIGVATTSYPTIGFVPNKHQVIKTNAAGNLLMARTYNHGSSHYPYLSRTRDQLGYLLSGFTNSYSPNFQPILIRMNNTFDSGCNETNVMPLTVQQNPPFQVRNPLRNISNGGVLANSNDENALYFGINTLCENIIDTCSITAATPQLSLTSDSFTIYIDNLSGNLIITSTRNESYSTQLYNSLGQLILHSNNENQINLSRLKHGFYFIKLFTNKKSQSLKFLY